MSTYTIKAVNGQREWESKYGPMISYDLNLEDENGKAAMQIELAQKKTTAPPTVGATLTGTIDWENKYGAKFKKEQAQGGGGGGGGRARDPKERESIERQVALKAAVELVNGIGSTGIEKPDSDYTKSALTGFFEHSLALIQGQAPPAPQKPTLAERAPTEPVPTASNGGRSPHDHAMDELRSRYVKWSGDDPDAPAAWQNKLTSMGLETPMDADDEQLDQLLEFLS